MKRILAALTAAIFLASFATTQAVNRYGSAFDAQRIFRTAIAANDTSVTIPANYRIASITIKETANNAITGGLDIGTTNGGQQIVAAYTVTALLYKTIEDSAIVTTGKVFAADTPIYINAHTGWNSANLNIQFDLVKVF